MKTTIKKILQVLLLAITLNIVIFSLQTFAAQGLPDTTFKVNNYLKLPDIFDEKGNKITQQNTGYFNDERGPIVGLIIRVLDYATGIMGTLGMIMLIIAGFQFMVAQGNDQKLGEAKETIFYAVVGLAIAFASYVIVVFIQSLFIPK